jgi:hypothetical protein
MQQTRCNLYAEGAAEDHIGECVDGRALAGTTGVDITPWFSQQVSCRPRHPRMMKMSFRSDHRALEPYFLPNVEWVTLGRKNFPTFGTAMASKGFQDRHSSSWMALLLCIVGYWPQNCTEASACLGLNQLRSMYLCLVPLLPFLWAVSLCSPEHRNFGNADSCRS